MTTLVRNRYYDLPFTRPMLAEGIDLWCPRVSGDYATDNRTGRQYAHDLIAFMKGKGNPSVLGRVVKAMVGHGVYGPVEIGFFQAISEGLIGQSLQTDNEHADRDPRNQGSEGCGARDVKPVALRHSPG